MKGIKLGFSLVDYAHARNMKIGSMRLKDGSSFKVLANSKGSNVEMYRIKYGRLLEAKGYRGPGAIDKSINEIARIKDSYGADDKYSRSISDHIFDAIG